MSDFQIKTIAQQPKNHWYAMELNFQLDLGLKSVNNILEQCGFHETPYVKNAATIKLKQILPFIPDKETLNAYAETIKETYSKKSEVTVQACIFTGYNYLYEIEEPKNS